MNPEEFLNFSPDEPEFQDSVHFKDLDRLTFVDTELEDLSTGAIGDISKKGKAIARTERQRVLLEIFSLLTSSKFERYELSESEIRDIKIALQKISYLFLYNPELLVAASIFIKKKSLTEKTLRVYSKDVGVDEIDLLRYIRFVLGVLKN